MREIATFSTHSVEGLHKELSPNLQLRDHARAVGILQPQKDKNSKWQEAVIQSKSVQETANVK